MTQDFSELPTDLPIPEDDGAGDPKARRSLIAF